MAYRNASGAEKAGYPAEGNFEVSNGDVGFRDKGFHGRETIGVVVGAFVICRIDLRLMLHKVSGEEQRNPFLCRKDYAARQKYEK